MTTTKTLTDAEKLCEQIKRGIWETLDELYRIHGDKLTPADRELIERTWADWM